MSKTHLVMITGAGYSLISSHDDDAAAVRAMAQFRQRSRSVCVLRHGSTGKRESVAEVEQRFAARPFEHCGSIWQRLAA